MTIEQATITQAVSQAAIEAAKAAVSGSDGSKRRSDYGIEK